MFSYNSPSIYQYFVITWKVRKLCLSNSVQNLFIFIYFTSSIYWIHCNSQEENFITRKYHICFARQDNSDTIGYYPKVIFARMVTGYYKEKKREAVACPNKMMPIHFKQTSFPFVLSPSSCHSYFQFLNHGTNKICASIPKVEYGALNSPTTWRHRSAFTEFWTVTRNRYKNNPCNLQDYVLLKVMQGGII